jgi:mannosyltransferase OCH1-like enzyme
MSAYKLIKCSIKDFDSLIKALADLGLKPNIHDEPQKLRGFLNDEREQLAQIIIPKEQLNKLFTKASNLGFTFNEETGQYDMICSEYDDKLNIPGRIKQAYAKAVIEEALESQYFSVESNDNEELRQRKQIKVQIVGKKFI